MKIKPLCIFLILLTSLACVCCRPPSGTDVSVTPMPPDNGVILGETSDMGEEYLNGFVFLGESTTYHMIDRAVLPGGKQTKQVWAPKNGTVNLDMHVDTLRIVYPESGEEMTVAQAATKKQPKYMVLTFGLNGAVQKVHKGADYFKSCYRKLIDAIRQASPSTTVLIQSAPPISPHMDMSRYSVDASTLNAYIKTINGWSMALCEEMELPYLNTQEILCDANGYLREEYQVGDGHHLTSQAYREILYYIRTHGCEGQSRKENA